MEIWMEECVEVGVTESVAQERFVPWAEEREASEYSE